MREKKSDNTTTQLHCYVATRALELPRRKFPKWKSALCIYTALTRASYYATYRYPWYLAASLLGTWYYHLSEAIQGISEIREFPRSAGNSQLLPRNSQNQD